MCWTRFDSGADAYVLAGKIADARRLFERLLGLRDVVALLSEEHDTDRRHLAGNYPQPSSDIAFIDTAHNPMRANKPAEQRSAS